MPNNVALNLHAVDDKLIDDEVEIPSKLIDDYKTLGEKVNRTLIRINKRRQAKND